MLREQGGTPYYTPWTPCSRKFGHKDMHMKRRKSRGRKTLLSGNVLNILRVYHQADAQEMQEGLLWYKTQIGLVHRLLKPDSPRITRSQVAGVTAALSPNKVWSHNIRLTQQLVRTGDAGTYKRQVAKATAILGGTHPLDVLVGPKERAFYLCFMGNKHAVTVDGHAYSVWMGSLIATSRAKVTPRRYVLAAQDYREAARQVGILPSQIQAITWLTHRRLHRSKGHVIDGNA